MQEDDYKEDCTMWIGGTWVQDGYFRREKESAGMTTRQDNPPHDEVGRETTPLEKAGSAQPTRIRKTSPLGGGGKRESADLGGIWRKSLSRGPRREDHCK
ncbi:hypothetical protein HY732_02425 [Candidatus Uhrbacteria bacterium]|nr:hypothetical protein [Candidatus Uhrbacteria bacterium]